MRKKFTIRLIDPPFNGKDSIEVTNSLSEFKWACNSSRNHEGATVWLLREFINGIALAANKARLPLSLNDKNRQKGSITSYAKVVSRLLRRYDTDAVIAKVDVEICNFKIGLFAR